MLEICEMHINKNRNNKEKKNTLGRIFRKFMFFSLCLVNSFRSSGFTRVFRAFQALKILVHFSHFVNITE